MNPLCRPLVTMRQALADPAIFGAVLAGESWSAWRVVLIASQGEPLTSDERTIFTALTGREHEPDQPLEELWAIAGRRAGKSRALAVLGTYLAALVDYAAVTAPGERIKLPILAATQKQAGKLFSYCAGLFTHAPDLIDLVNGEMTSDTIRLTNGVDIEVRAANFRSIRGETLAGALCDEISVWHVEGSANPDAEILNAIRPGLATTHGPLVVLSSPYARKGELWRTFDRDYGPKGDPAVLVLRAASLTLNPSLDPKVVERAYARDPAAAAAEFGAQFRGDIESLFTVEAVRACVDVGIHERSPTPETRYVGFVDVAGGGADAMTLGIGHREGNIAVLDAIREEPVGTNPSTVVKSFAATLKAYGIREVTGDRYAGEWPREQFREHGIIYKVSDKSKTEIYSALLPIINTQACRLLDVPKLETQLIALERRTTRGTGRAVIDHPQIKGQHDDTANAAGGALVLLASKARGRTLMDLYADDERGREADRRLQGWWVTQQAGVY